MSLRVHCVRISVPCPHGSAFRKVLLDPKQIFVEDADPDNILSPNGTSVGSVGTVGSEIEL